MRQHLVLSVFAGLLSACVAATAPPDNRGGAGRSAIVGGDAADAAAFPYFVGLFYAGGVGLEPVGPHFCGGSLIAPDLVLTAAHCVQDLPADQVRVVFGSDRRSAASFPSTASVHEVREVRIHPDYCHPPAGLPSDSVNLERDLAVLALATPAPGSAVQLATEPDVALMEPGRIARVVGFGRTGFEAAPSEELLTTEVSILAPGAYPVAPYQASMIAAGALGRDSCLGDSGGPLVVETAGGPVQIGLVSHGPDSRYDPSSSSCASHTFFTRVASYGAWIRGARVSSAGTVPLCLAPSPAPAPTPAPTPGSLCDDTCTYARNGTCDDGGPGSSYSDCGLGTDCTDCGARTGEEPRPPGEETTDPGAGPMCLPQRSACAGSTTACCTGLECRAGVTFGVRCCAGAGSSCRDGGDCCGTMACVSGQCACQGPTDRCVDDGDCCSGSCDAGTCR